MRTRAIGIVLVSAHHQKSSGPGGDVTINRRGFE
jgi:hypothetical protein